MTAKRFTKCCPKIRDYGEEMSCTEVCDLLNELAEENQQLINDCSILVQSNQDYRKENEQLKQFIQELTTKGTGKIHLANGNIYKVNAILTDFKR